MAANLIVTAALMVANMAMTALRKIEGPRLDDLKFTSGDYGSPIPHIWGTRVVQPPVFWGEDLREVKQRRKTKGGKFNDYTYYGTWACALASHEIAGITRVWFDKHLVYDLTGSGQVSPFDLGDAGAITEFFTVYHGTEAQDADERIAATVEAAHGAGSCPAYRGTAYVVFKDLPLEKLGNRIPQVSVEVVSATTAHYPYKRLVGVPTASETILFSADSSKLVVGAINFIDGNVAYDVYDAAASALMISSVTDSWNIFAIGADGTLWAASPFADGSSTEIVGLTPDGTGIAYPSGGTTGMEIGDLWVFEQGTSTLIYGKSETGTHYLATATPGADPTLIDVQALTGAAEAWQPRSCFQDADGDIWVAGALIGNATLHLLNLTTGANLAVAMGSVLSALSDEIGARHFQDSTHDHFLVGWNNTVKLIDRTTGTILGSVSHNSLAAVTPFRHAKPSDTSWYSKDTSNSVKEFSSLDGSTIRTLSLGTWTSASQTIGIYDRINHAWVALADGDIIWFYLDRLSGDGVLLSDIASDIADMVGVEDYDFSALDQTVLGWSVTQGQASNMLEPLLDAYDSDIVPHDFTILGKKRGASASTTITTPYFVKNDPRYTVKVRQSVELPRALTYNFADLDSDQQPNNIRVERPQDTTAGKDERSIDLSTFASDPDTMRGLAERHFRRLVGERREVQLSLTMQQLSLAPGDLRILDLDGETMAARCVKTVVKASGEIETDWRFDHPSFATLSGATGAAMDGRTPSTIIVPLISKGFALDIPLLSDVDQSANPGLYIAAGPYAAGSWPGATFFEEVDGEYSEELNGIPSTSQAVWGYATDVLGDALATVWDRGSSVNVVLQVGALTGITEAAIDADPSANLALLGDELINFTTATLEGDGSYTLSGFKRGRRGTEQHTAAHAVRDVFLLLDIASVQALGLSDVGTDMSFKAITSGRTATSAFPLPVTPFTGASLKPYSPAHLGATLVSGDWVLTWTRRTRIGGAWTSGTSIPLSEASEEYAVEIMNGSSVVRTITGLTSATTTWTAAQQTTDFGSGQSHVTYRVYQISDAVGRGFVATVTV